MGVDLRDLLETYEVTAVPMRVAGATLSVVWSEPDEVPAHDADAPIVLAILDDYRITRVPKAS
jgi:hypothetical protein